MYNIVNKLYELCAQLFIKNLIHISVSKTVTKLNIFKQCNFHLKKSENFKKKLRNTVMRC